MSLPRTARKVVLTAHVLSSVGWFGIAVLVAAAALTAGATGDQPLADGLHRAIGASLWVSVPAGLVAFATGVLLGVGTRWGLVKHWWVLVKIVLNLAVVVTDLVVVRAFAHDAIVGSPQRLSHALIAHCVVLAVATVLSTFKPFGTVRPRTRQVQRLSGASS
jgi:hypothetical protein